MKHTFKKIAATLSAAVMCALPAVNALSANATASANARYTMRKVYWVDGSANVKKLEFGFTNQRGGCSPATITTIAPGTKSVGGSAGDSYYNCGGTLTGYGYISGPALSFSVVCDKPSYYKEGSNVYCRAYKANGTQSFNSVRYSQAFLVGDLSGNNVIDGYDYAILDYALNQFGINSYGFDSQVNIWGNTVKKYQMDIDDDGDVDSADSALLMKYISGQITRFEK